MQGICRWGILGTATIARKFWRSARLAGNARVVAVASRDSSRAQTFVDEAQSRFPAPAAAAVGGYDALLERQDLDAVYIPLPTGLRREWVEAAAARGLHVLCEKPCALSLDDLLSMVGRCRRAGVLFMDNVMFHHSRRTAALLDRLRDRDWFGELRRMTSQFSFPAPPEFFQGNIRADQRLEPWGCLGDLGWYSIRMALVAGPVQWPVAVRARAWNGGRSGISGNGPPVEFSGEMTLAGDATASLYCSFVAANQQWIQFSGTRASLSMDDFVLPWFGCRTGWRENSPEFNRSGWDFNYESRERVSWVDEYGNGDPSAQEACLVRRFSEQVLAGRPEDEWGNLALRTQALMEGLVESSVRQGAETMVQDPLARMQ